MKRLACAAAAAAAAFAPAQAAACIVPSGRSAFIHNSVPAALASELIVARVEFEAADVDAVYKAGVRARVIEMIQGHYDGQVLIVRAVATSCSDPFGNGTSGLIVALPVGREDGLLIVDPLSATQASGYRLPPGFWLPPNFFARPLMR